ncbi:MAG: hypothetical protein HY549_13320 [Elusimicrobia bacterium]|nr:hypothetical protein [Elusimicrobiota bacterium]
MRATGLLLFASLALAWPSCARAAALQISAYDGAGQALGAAEFLSYISRADRKNASPERMALVLIQPDGAQWVRPALSGSSRTITLSWERLNRVSISVAWPISGGGFSTLWADKEGRGYSDGENILLNEELAVTQYRLFKEAWQRHISEMDPVYAPSRETRKLADETLALMKEAHAAQSGPSRAAGFDKALQAVSRTWEKMLVEHGRQIARHPRRGSSLRFGLTLDESLLKRLDHYPWIIQSVKRSGAGWVRLVFRSNPSDFAYARQRSFNEYDGLVAALKASGLQIMGCALDTAQWPSQLTPEFYGERVKNLVLHYRGSISSWEVGSEINGDWLGGLSSPLPSDKVFRIYSAGVSAVKSVDPSLETVATLYWWENTAPDHEHSLFGWLKRFVPQGFGKDLDVLGLSLETQDNPLGLALEPVFESLRQTLPSQKLMVGSLSHGDGNELRGYWWLDPSDIEASRTDLISLNTPAACALRGSIGGGFWWHTLGQMLPSKRKAAEPYRAYRHALKQLGR